MGIIISHYKDFYEPISIMECHKGFERCSCDARLCLFRHFAGLFFFETANLSAYTHVPYI